MNRISREHARKIVEKAWHYNGRFGVTFHNRRFEANSKTALIRELQSIKMNKCPLFDKCGLIFEGIQPHHEWCYDYEYAKQECDLL